MSLLKAKLKDMFSTDLRSLAIMRVGVALLILADLGLRATSIVEFYTDQGFLPRKYIFASYGWHPISLHALSGSWQFEAFLFGVAAFFALLLLVGYKTKLVTIVSFLLLLSLQNRNLVVLLGGDYILRLLLFWGMFVPWNARFSLDSMNSIRLKSLPNRVFSLGIAGYILQICFIYFFAAMLKTGAAWNKDYSAVYYAVHFQLLATPFAGILAYLPLNVLSLITYSTRLLEILAPFLILSPFYTPYLRLLAIFLLTGMHLGFKAAMALGIFPFIDIVSLFGLLPTLFWDRLFNFLENKVPKLKIYYDHDCGLCHWVCRVLKTFFLLPSAQIIPAQKDPKLSKLMDKEQSWIVEDGKGRRFLRSAALVPIFKASPMLFIFLPVTFIPGIFKFGDLFYNFISKRRHSICSIPQDENKRNTLIDFSWPLNLIALFFIIYIFLVNLNSVNFGYKPPLTLTYALGVNQKWTMFAPAPPVYNWSYEAQGEFDDGTKINVLATPSYMQRNYLRANFFLSFGPQQRFNVQRGYAYFLCQTWNGNHNGSKKIKTIEARIIYKKIPPPDNAKINTKSYAIKLPKYICEN